MIRNEARGTILAGGIALVGGALALGLIGMWRNVTPAVDVVAAANNCLLPAWMIGFGVWLVMTSRTERLTPAHL